MNIEHMKLLLVLSSHSETCTKHSLYSSCFCLVCGVMQGLYLYLFFERSKTETTGARCFPKPKEEMCKGTQPNALSHS